MNLEAFIKSLVTLGPIKKSLFEFLRDTDSFTSLQKSMLGMNATSKVVELTELNGIPFLEWWFNAYVEENEEFTLQVEDIKYWSSHNFYIYEG